MPPDLFAVLHGNELSQAAETLVPTLQHMATLGKLTLNVPSIAPVVVAPTLGMAPVRVLKTFKSLADELDRHGWADVAPMQPQAFCPVQGHTATYEHDSLP